MPSSTYKILTKACEAILRIQPKTVLDIGIGFGKWGFLCREYLECWKDRVFPKQWQIQLDGIEIFVPYTTLPHVQSIYDDIFVGDVIEILSKLGKYELIIAMDVLEHMDKDAGLGVAVEILSKFTRAALINVPTGNWMHNMVVAGNEAERHRAIWEASDLKGLADKTQTTVDIFNWEQNGKTGSLGFFKR